MIASIPSPTFNSIEIGPLSLNLYGLMIALGVIAAVWLFGKRLEERGIGTRDDASSIAIWGVLAGVIGARLWHVATDYERFRNNWGEIPAIWNGGLGIPGGLLLGTAAGLYVGKRRGIPLAAGLTCAAPAIPLAQAIGRWGNYFNQELYGRPTTLPWGLEIDAQHLETGYTVGTLFHPTFLYESLWSLGLCFLLLWIDKRFRPAPGQLFVMYVIGYGVGRFWVEGLRIDPADEVLGMRFNQLVALIAVIAGVIGLVWMRRHPFPEPAIAGDGPGDVEPGLDEVVPDEPGLDEVVADEPGLDEVVPDEVIRDEVERDDDADPVASSDPGDDRDRD
jgi:prolipoprotein diacylglyceryl transferase